LAYRRDLPSLSKGLFVTIKVAKKLFVTIKVFFAQKKITTNAEKKFFQKFTL